LLHGEEDGGAPRPEAREVSIDRLTAPEMQAFGDGHEQWHADADRREDDVERERDMAIWERAKTKSVMGRGA
jgi:hypothetical protein